MRLWLVWRRMASEKLVQRNFGGILCLCLLRCMVLPGRGEEADGVTTLEGEFAGYKGCRVEVSTLKGKDLVSRINVSFPAQKRWAGLYGNYKDLKDMMTAKYGQPTGCVEEFRKDVGWEKIDDDHDKYLKVMVEKATFETTFRFTNGTILLRMARSEKLDCFVQLSYMDKENDSAVKKHAMDDL